MNKRQRQLQRQREMEQEREAPTLWGARPLPWLKGGLRNALDRIKDNDGRSDMAACYARFIAARDGITLTDATCFVADWHSEGGADIEGSWRRTPYRKLYVAAVVFHKGRPPSSNWSSGYCEHWRSDGEIASIEIPNPDARKAHWMRQVAE